MQIQNIVFPVDFSDRSRAAAPFVQSMARRYDAAVHLIHAVPPLPALYFDIGTAYSEAFDPAPMTDELRKRLIEFGADNFPHMDITCAVVSGEPARSIFDCAAQNEADLIALPTHGYGVFRRALLGSVTAKILHDAAIPVWTSAHCADPSHRAHPQPRTVVVAVPTVEAADESDPVYRTALAVAKHAGAALEPVGILPGQTPDSIELTLRQAALHYRADLVVVGRARHCHTYTVICESPCPVLSV
jgi:nucleotide-binding universal stress UspA family protein